MTRDKAYRLAVIVVLQLVGILAGVQLGKIAPLVEWYQNEIGFSLVLIGWFTSMIGIFVAAAALPAGWAIERAGPANTFLTGSVVMTIGGIALALFVSPAAILASRLVEGAGYLVLVIATPALLAAISPDRWKPPAVRRATCCWRLPPSPSWPPSPPSCCAPPASSPRLPPQVSPKARSPRP
jgi:MFS family permease